MNWADERYVRVYTRDTDDWLCLSWEARALFVSVLRKVDRAGVLETKRGARGMAVLVGMPALVVETALSELLADGCVAEHPLGYCVPNFVVAQEARASDRARAKTARERRRDGIPSRDVTPPSRDVTPPSREIDSRHTPSQAVTPSRATPILAVPSQIRGAASSVTIPSQNVTPSDDYDRFHVAFAAAAEKQGRTHTIPLPGSKLERDTLSAIHQHGIAIVLAAIPVAAKTDVWPFNKSRDLATFLMHFDKLPASVEEVLDRQWARLADLAGEEERYFARGEQPPWFSDPLRRRMTHDRMNQPLRLIPEAGA